jgi:hypothetical protein
MRLSLVKLPAIATVLALIVTGCSSDKGSGPRPTGPVTMRFLTPVFDTDTVTGRLILDGKDTLAIPRDSLVGVARGQHTFEVRLDLDYITSVFTDNIDPNATSISYRILQTGTCRLWQFDSDFCSGKNLIFWGQNKRVLCPASDFGEFCTTNADRFGLGLTWPSDSIVNAGNEYVTHGKLLIGAIAGAGSPRAGDTLAMAFDRGGDYSPRTRLHVFGIADSSRYQGDAWTDARHIPLYPNAFSFLNDTDRVGANFGLSVRTTYYRPVARADAMFLRFDITNISNDPEYRRVHAEEPVAGHTITDIYLTPVIDADIGGTGLAEYADDLGTMFPADSVVVAYDRTFNVSTFSTGYVTKPALVGLQLLAGPVGATGKGVIFDQDDTLRYSDRRIEGRTYRYLAAGRAGPITGCVDAGSALVCAPEGGGGIPVDIRIGWSVGPVASLAPGQTTSLTVAVLLALPKAGSYVNGTEYLPQNTLLSDTTRTIFKIGENLRALAAQTKTVTVDGTPFMFRR